MSTRSQERKSALRRVSAAARQMRRGIVGSCCELQEPREQGATRIISSRCKRVNVHVEAEEADDRIKGNAGQARGSHAACHILPR